ncbi:transglycosylase domain-containing protein [Corynebacterium sp. HMSC04H06]|uniref:transglycosylase domain-containing protein n=1 Tax=Corynebacterium sp. HMSC04H06 TaxID=1581050 RepID=UPI0008A54DBD|nr:penicillin-binding protein [Corynebacterium sp. HMSC04H06]
MTDKSGSRTRDDQGAAKPASAGQAKNKRRWPWIVLAVVGVTVFLPLAIFAYAYAQYDVPEPEELTNNQISYIYANDSSTQLARIVPPEGNRSQVKLDEIPDHTENAALAAEDREFWTNSGFSLSGFARAVLGEITGDSSAGGGSTITQQYVKNTLVGDERSYVRKARELIYSVKMTNEWSKEDILNAYLNTVYFGRNAYGIQAASNAYFDKNVEDLTVEESALLAGVIQAPSALDPAVDENAAQARWNYVMDGLVDMGELDAAERAGMQMPQTREQGEYSAYTEAPGANGHIKNQVIRELGEVGITEEDVNTRGLRITTTIDMNVQNAGIDAVDTNLAPLQDDARAAAVTIEPSTGAIRGYFGGHEEHGWDYANAPLQTGSTFKIMALAAGLQQGISLDTNYSSAPYQLPGSQVVNNVNGSGCGVCSLREATKKSYNTSFIRLQEDLKNTTQDTADMAHALGVARSLPGIEKTLTENGKQPYEGIVLGQYQSRPMDMAIAMATLANQGVWHNPHFVEKVETISGEVLYEHPTDKGERRVGQQVANNVIDAMRPVAAWSNGALAGGRESASKTGTAQLGDTGYNKDTWMVGATPQLATAVWVGTAENTDAIFNAYGGNMYGAGAPTQIWKSILDTSLAEADYETFPQAAPVRYGTGGAGGGATYYAPTEDTYAPTDSEGVEEAPAEGEEEQPSQPAPAEPSRNPNESPGGGGGNAPSGGNGGGNGGGDGNPSLEDFLEDPQGGLADILG